MGGWQSFGTASTARGGPRPGRPPGGGVGCGGAAEGGVATWRSPPGVSLVWRASGRGGAVALEAEALQIPRFYRGVPVVTRRFVETAHRSGVAVHVWTVNQPGEMRRLLDLGVDGLITDRPDLLRPLLQPRP